MIVNADSRHEGPIHQPRSSLIDRVICEIDTLYDDLFAFLYDLRRSGVGIALIVFLGIVAVEIAVGVFV